MGENMINLVQAVYNQVLRPTLPRKIAVFNGVAVREPKLLDSFDHDPSYKAGLIAAVRHEVTDGDDVTIIGGGHGVSSITAARRTGTNGHVTVYEAGENWVQKVAATMALNDIPEDQYTIRHALVGPAVDVDGTMADAEKIQAADLKIGDVLEMDCEGAELDILEELSEEQCPRAVIVETHPEKGSETAFVRSALCNLGFCVEKVGEDERDGDVLMGRSDTNR